MTKFIPTIAAALLATAIATPVFAQAAIQEPGAYAFAHPNADVLQGRYAVRPFDSTNARRTRIMARPCPHVIACRSRRGIVAQRDNERSLMLVAQGRVRDRASVPCEFYPAARIALSNRSPPDKALTRSRRFVAGWI